MSEPGTVTGPRLIIGAGGSGKTHLLDALAAEADAAGAAVVRLAGDPTLGAVCLVANIVEGFPNAGATVDQAPALAHALAAAAGDDGVVLADDLHQLDEVSLVALRLYLEAGGLVIGTARPAQQGSEGADLADALRRHGGVQRLDGLGHEPLAAAVSGWLGEPAPAELVDNVLELSGGAPGLAHDLVAGGLRADNGDLPQGVVDRMLIHLQRVSEPAAELARALAMNASLPDAAMAQLAGIGVHEVAVAADELRSAGLAEPDDDRLIPVVAQAIAASWSPTERRRRHSAVADALMSAGVNDEQVARHLREAAATGVAAARAFVAAGDRVRWQNPAEALKWYEQALSAGATPSATAVGRAEAGLATGAPDVRILIDQFDRDDPAQRARARIVLAALDASDTRADRAATRLLETVDHPEIATPALRRLAVPFLVALGRVDEARAVCAEGPLDDLDTTHRLADLLAASSLTSLEGRDPIPLLVEAAELTETTPPPLPPLLTPHALAAAHAELIGDFSVGESLLARAIQREVGGPASAVHHQLLQAWIRFRQGRHDTAARLVSELEPDTLSPRDALLVAALDAGLGRRSGDIARLQDSWTGVETALLRQTVDLTTFGPVGELVLAAARLGEMDRADAVQRQLVAVVDLHDPATPPAWAAALCWHEVQLAVVTDDTDRAGAAASAMEATPEPSGERPATFARAVTLAARAWTELLHERVDLDGVGSAVDLLHDAQLPWDAARLAGQAALKVTDAGAARILLERARTLKTPLPDPDVGRTVDSPLSDHEQEVATLLVDGLTYKEIGAQLYISAKTVEHHVARIRQKLGAGSRAELLAALRDLV